MAASVEAMLDLWSAALREGKARLRLRTAVRKCATEAAG